jgi:hypothetical protein
VLVPVDAPVDAWSEAVLSLWNEPEAYDRYARAAERHSRRPEIDPYHVTSRFVEALEEMLAHPTPPEGS